MLPKEEPYNDEEIARRRDEVVRRMANTPPKPHSEMTLGKRKVEASTKASPGVPSDSGKAKQGSK